MQSQVTLGIPVTARSKGVGGVLLSSRQTLRAAGSLLWKFLANLSGGVRNGLEFRELRVSWAHTGKVLIIASVCKGSGDGVDILW